MSLEAAQRYCRSMARNHYENFIVGSVLVPRRYMQHLYNIYAFCRSSDDLADEIGDPVKSAEMLAQWREELKRCYEGSSDHPVMVALKTTVDKFEIPPKLFEDLISAFEQDCKVTRYGSYSDVLEYCKCSANPVGRLFLWIFGYKDDRRQELSDRICTGLQLANFWQDVSQDYERGRVYIPKEDMESFGCSEAEIAQREPTSAFVRLMEFEVNRTVDLFESAASLPSMLNRRLAIDVELFRRAGISVLQQIRANGYDVLTHRPTCSKMQKARLFLSCLFGR